MRAHFRSTLLSEHRDAAVEVTDLLETGRSSDVRNLDEVGPVVNAIGLLMEACQVEQAHQLYRERFAGGWAFRQLAAPWDGLQCGIRLVGNPPRRELITRRLSDGVLAAYLHRTAICAWWVAEFELAERLLRDSMEIRQRTGDDLHLAADLRILSALLADRGRLTEAEVAARRDVELSSRLRAEQNAGALAQLADVLALQGVSGDAVASFEEAVAHMRKMSRGEGDLYATHGVDWANLMVLLGRRIEARDLTERNLRVTRRRRQGVDVPRCQWMLGRLDTIDGDYAAAAEHLRAAAATLRPAHMLTDLVRIQLGQGDLARRQARWDDAERLVSEALDVAAARGMPLRQAEALVLRGRILFDRKASDLWSADALDDAASALTLSLPSGYAWAQRDALQLRADIYLSIDDLVHAQEARQAAEQLSRRLLTV